MTDEALIKYFKINDKKNKELLKIGNFKLKYDYTDVAFLKYLDEISSKKIDINGIVNLKVEYDFDKALTILFDEVESNGIKLFFESALKNSKIEYKNIEISESHTTIRKKDNKYSCDIIVPDYLNKSLLLYSIIIHELTHFSLSNNKKIDYFEYSEALSIYFEYFLYNTLGREFGPSLFLNNRVKFLNQVFEYMQNDIIYPLHKEYLELDPKIYETTIASHLAYIESFEYALNLFEKRKDNKKAVDNYIKDALNGEETVRKIENNLDFVVSSHKKLRKIIKM
ncbi:MAG: hypothetical protein IJ568_03445 [Bacilli bacterium]|nr:hypothetical protein [Bacilli bacterium]